MESNIRAVDRLLNDSIFKYPATDMLGPLISQQVLIGAVLVIAISIS